MNSSRSVLVTDAGAVLADVVVHLEAAGVDVTVLEPGATAEDAAARAAGVPVVVIGVLPFGRGPIESLRDTKLLIRAGIGYDIVDVDAASDAGIWVANVPDFCVDEVADHTTLLLGAAMRRLPDALTRWREEGRWNVVPELPAMRRMRGKQLGLIGLGRIGRQVAARAQAFGWDVVAYDPAPGATDPAGSVPLLPLDEVLATSDAVSLHCPLTPDTHHLINDERLAGMRPGAVLVNTSRGGLVDLDALHRALTTGTLGLAALDVVDGEPTPDLGHPLYGLDTIIVTPHVAWYSVEAQQELARNTAAEALRFLDGGRPRHLINPDARA